MCCDVTQTLAADSEASCIFYRISRKSGHNIADGVHNSMLPRCQFYMILHQLSDGAKKELLQADMKYAFQCDPR